MKYPIWVTLYDGTLPMVHIGDGVYQNTWTGLQVKANWRDGLLILEDGRELRECSYGELVRKRTGAVI